MNYITLAIRNTFLVIFLFLITYQTSHASDFVKTIKRVQPSVVGIGTVNPIASPKSQLMGTGFVITDGLHIVTNHHVLPIQLEPKEEIVVFIGKGKKPEVRRATIVKKSALYDLAILKISGKPLKSFKLGASPMIDEGTEIAFTGFPIGAVLGLYPATHQGLISSLTPLASPMPNSKLLEITHIKRLRDPFLVYQLDATAYPGNSGSPIYDKKTGIVYGVINQVFVKEGKESALSKPSGISYAIPVKYLHKMLKEISGN